MTAHLKQQVRQQQEETQKLMVFLTQSTGGKIRYLHILITGPAYWQWYFP